MGGSLSKLRQATGSGKHKKYSVSGTKKPCSTQNINGTNNQQAEKIINVNAKSIIPTASSAELLPVAGGSKNISMRNDIGKIGNMETHITGDKNTVEISHTANSGPHNVSQHANVISNNFNNGPGTLVPRRDPINNTELPVDTFIGRVTELNDIKQHFKRYPVVVIAAMGGMGKTQLARKFAFVNADVYRVRYWINAETPQQLLNSFDRLARIVNVHANTDIDTVRDAYRSFNDDAALLIFDNVEHVNDVYNYLPTRIQLQNITLHVLVTSRWTEWSSDSLVYCYKLQPFDMSASVQIFQRKFGETCIETMQDKWEELARMLGRLPLALQVATSYIHNRNKHNFDLRTVLTDYMKELTKGARNLLTDTLTQYDNGSVLASMLLTLEQLEHKTDDEWKLAVTLINVAAYMYPNGIYKKHLLKLLDNDDNTWILDKALVILTGFSLFNQRVDWAGANIYSVHRIIQSSIRHNQTENKTADIHYTKAMSNAIANNYYSTYVFQYANERASTVVCYYKENPTSRLLEYLVRCKAITAVEGIFNSMSRDEIESVIQQGDLLHRAVDSGDLSMTQLLCNNGANINQLTLMTAEPPLHRAVWRGNMDIVQWMLQNSISLTVRDREGRTALHVAIMYGKHELVPDIIQADKALVHATDNEGNTVLHSAARGACAVAVKLILQLNKDLINIVNENGQTALHVLGIGFIDDMEYLTEKNRENVFEDFKESARLLIMNGLSMDTRDKERRTPLDIFPPELKDILLQVADECSNQLLVRAVERLGTE